eukprot:jgi/Mesen1/7088/ME000369S06412
MDLLPSASLVLCVLMLAVGATGQGPSSYLVSLGSTEPVEDSSGRTWAADPFLQGTPMELSPPGTVLNGTVAADPRVYSRGVFVDAPGVLAFNLSVRAPGRHWLRLHFAAFPTARHPDPARARFNATAGGVLLLSNYSVVADSYLQRSGARELGGDNAVAANLSFAFRVPRGANYLVRLVFCENEYPQAFYRLMNLYVNGRAVLTGVDVLRDDGYHRAAARTFLVPLPTLPPGAAAAGDGGEGELIVDIGPSVNSQVQNPMVSGFEILRAGTSALAGPSSSLELPPVESPAAAPAPTRGGGGGGGSGVNGGLPAARTLLLCAAASE